jgi:hypothetical protein
LGFGLQVLGFRMFFFVSVALGKMAVANDEFPGKPEAGSPKPEAWSPKSDARGIPKPTALPDG